MAWHLWVAKTTLAPFETSFGSEKEKLWAWWTTGLHAFLKVLVSRRPLTEEVVWHMAFSSHVKLWSLLIVKVKHHLFKAPSPYIYTDYIEARAVWGRKCVTWSWKTYSERQLRQSKLCSSLLEHISWKDALQEKWLQVSTAPRLPVQLSHSGKSSWQQIEGKGSFSQAAVKSF